MLGKNSTCFKNTKLSHKSRGRLLMTFLYSPLAFSCKTRATRKRDVIRMQSIMDTASRYLCKTRLSQMKARHINHSDLRALLQVPPLQAAMEREQMRWLGHISRMTPDTPTTHARTFARGTIDVGNFARQASSDGGRINADRKSLPEVWISLCHKHGFGEADVEQLASDRNAWNALLDQRVAQAIFEDRQLSHSHRNTLPDPGLQGSGQPVGERDLPLLTKFAFKNNVIAEPLLRQHLRQLDLEDLQLLETLELLPNHDKSEGTLKTRCTMRDTINVG